MTDRVRLVIADDHPIVRKGLRAALEEDPGLAVVGEAGDGDAALALILQERPDVAVLDVDMPKLDGFGVVREAASRSLPTRLILLTLHDDDELFRAALELGVAGYLLKDSAMVELIAAVHTVAEGRPVYSSTLAARLLRPRQPAPAAESPLAALTPTERRIMRQIAAGESSKEIGATLGLHYRTVENHRTNICRKLGIEGAHALLRFALQHREAFGGEGGGA